ncbi:MAG: hypothetical protein V1925_05085 [Candidatus Omnitrophota bacterium]
MRFFIQSGCLLPFLIVFNLIFGWLIFPAPAWFLLGGILILLFAINSYILVKKAASFSSSSRRGNDAIDVEAQEEEGPGPA